MKSWILTAVAIIFCAACASRPQEPDFPAAVGDWRLASPAVHTGEKWTARYQGSPDITVEVTRMSSTTSAFSAVQSWRGEAGKLAFYHGRHFGIASAAGADHQSLNRFGAAFEKTLPE